LDADWTAYERVEALLRNNPKLAWQVIAQIIERAPDEEMLFAIAAYPLELLLEKDGEVVIAEIEVAARRSAKVRRCLSGVWGNHIAPEVWARMGQAVRDLEN